MNECEIFYENNIISILKFNTYFDIELSFPTNKNNEYLNEYHLKNLLEFKYNSNTSIKGAVKNDITKINFYHKNSNNKDLIKIILHFPPNLNEQTNI